MIPDTRNRLGLRDISRSSSRDLSKNSYSDPSVRAIVAEVLTCVYQSTIHSSATTREAACKIAGAVGANFP